MHVHNAIHNVSNSYLYQKDTIPYQIRFSDCKIAYLNNTALHFHKNERMEVGNVSFVRFIRHDIVRSSMLLGNSAMEDSNKFFKVTRHQIPYAGTHVGLSR